MIFSDSLRNRVAFAFALFGAMVSMALAIAIYIASHNLESRLIEDTLAAELDDYIERRERNPDSLPEHTATISAYVVADTGGTFPVPHELQRLNPGFHSLSIENIDYLAAVRQVGLQRFVVLYNTSALQQREIDYLILLSSSVLLMTLASAFAGRWLATRTIAPVTELAHRVTQLHPEDEPTTLASDFSWMEIRQLAGDFDSYLKRLHDFIERERLFTGDISHELRTPIAVIMGASELMLSDQALDDKNRNRVARIYRATSEMDEISCALLALAREQGDASRPSGGSEVVTVVSDVVERYRDLYSHKPVELMFEVLASPQQLVDPAILSMVLGNLVRNALSFTQQGQVRITLDHNHIHIVDTGPGLHDNNPADLFQSYVRGSESVGAGLGLSLVLRLCEKQGWRVTLNNHPQGGTVAELFLSSPANTGQRD